MTAAGLAGARVVVAGLGVTGRAVVEAVHGVASAVVTVDARAADADVTGHDAADPAMLDRVVADADLLVTSPGWPPSSPLLVAARAAGVPVWSEVELAWRLRSGAPWLAVTGTNGKTTTVQMLAAILTAAGLRTATVGNVGTPVLAAAQDPDLDVLAVELSSFQLHHTSTMAVEAGAVLNIADDHLDWHGGAQEYAAAKGRIYAGARRACVYNVADPRTEELVRDADVADGALAVGFTLGAPGPGQVGLVEDVLVDRAFHTAVDDPARHRTAAEIATLDDLAHLGAGGAPGHVVEDALAAAALARAHGVPATAVRDGLRAFRADRHRSAVVRTLDGVAYVDDSKATNAHAAAASLASCRPGSAVWIAGGLAKGARFDDLVTARADRLHAAVVIGVDPAPFTDALARHAPEIPVVVIDPGQTGTVMRRAVEVARGLAAPGDTVLLAPAGASMDQFASYAARGDAFAAAVADLGEEHDGRRTGGTPDR